MNRKVKVLAGSAAAIGANLLVAAQAFAQTSTIVIEPSKGYALDFTGLFNFVLRAVLAIAALLVFGYLVMGGIEYITSGGDKGKTEKARDKITAAVIGLIILAASWAILQLALNFLGFSNLQEVVRGVGTIQSTP